MHRVDCLLALHWFHLPAAHIAAIVAYAVRTRPGYEPRYEAAPGVWKSITRDNAAEVAAILAQANANAYAERYRETPQPVTVTPPMIHNARALRPVELLKACHGYDYQTSDWSDYDTSAAHAIITRIIRAACERLDGYTDAGTWVISDPAPKPETVTVRYTVIAL